MSARRHVDGFAPIVLLWRVRRVLCFLQETKGRVAPKANFVFPDESIKNTGVGIEGNYLVRGAVLLRPPTPNFPARSDPAFRDPSMRVPGGMVLDPPVSTRRRGSLRTRDAPSSSKSVSDGTETPEQMRAVASRLEKHTAVLRTVIAQTSFLEDAGSMVKTSPAEAAKKALEADIRVLSDSASSSDEDDSLKAEKNGTRLRAYQTADFHLKKAAAVVAGSRDRPDGKSAAATAARMEALEELKLASMVLQRRHDEDAKEFLQLENSQKRNRKSTSRSGDVASSSSHHMDTDQRQNINKMNAMVIGRVRTALKPLAVTVEAFATTARRLRQDAESIETKELQFSKQINALKKQRDDALALAASEKIKRETTPATVVTVVQEKNKESKKGKENEKKEKKVKEVVEIENQLPEMFVDPNPELIDKLRVVTESRDDFARRLRRAHITAETETHTLAAQARDLTKRVTEAQDKARQNLEEKEKWRALYVAVREDFSGGVGAVEAEELRAATRRAENARRRELSLLGAEHGNQCASLKRALADSEREKRDSVLAVERAERRMKEAVVSLESEKSKTEVAEQRARKSEGEVRRIAKRLEMLEQDLASTQLRLEETENQSRETQKHEMVARLETKKELEKLRLESGKSDDWRVRAAEAKFTAAAETARREKGRADNAERTLDEERRRVVEQQAVIAGDAMADAVKRWGG